MTNDQDATEVTLKFVPVGSVINAENLVLHSQKLFLSLKNGEDDLRNCWQAVCWRMGDERGNGFVRRCAAVGFVGRSDE